MDDHRLGTAVRQVRLRRRWRQVDLAGKAGVSASFVSRLERGHVGPQTVDGIRSVASALDIRVDLVPRWRAGDLDRLLNARHSGLHEVVARWFRRTNPAWILAPEVSFAIYSDRGVMDILAWHPGRRSVLVIELKTELVDMNELLGTLDRKRRVAATVAADHHWDPLTISAWLIVADSRTNRRRVEAHETMLSGALPHGGPTIRNWLRDPMGSIGALSFWSGESGQTRGAAPLRRVRQHSTARPVADGRSQP